MRLYLLYDAEEEFSKYPRGLKIEFSILWFRIQSI